MITLLLSHWLITSVAPADSTAPVQSTAPIADRRHEAPVLPDHILDILEEESEVPPEVARLVSRSVLLKAQLRWSPGSRLNVCFRKGPENVLERIVAVASNWNKQANITLDFGPKGSRRRCSKGDGSDIRVGFNAGGYWSIVGRQSRDVADTNQITLNLEGFHTAPPARDEFNNTVLHEFGHALGFEHEHQHPDASCANEFDWPKAYAYYAEYPNYWEPPDVDANMKPLLKSEVDAGAYDPKSVMHYLFDRSIFLDPSTAKCLTDLNSALSKGDVAALKAAYPPDEKAADEFADALIQLTGEVETLTKDNRISPDALSPLLQSLRSDLTILKARAE